MIDADCKQIGTLKMYLSMFMLVRLSSVLPIRPT